MKVARLAALLPARPLVRAEDDVARELHRDRLARRVLAADDDQVADAALGELALDRRHPGAAGAAVGAGRVQQDAGVPHVLAAVGPLPPLVLDDQVIVAVLLLGGDVAEAVAGDVEHAVLDAEDLARVVGLRVLEPGGQAGQVLAVEEGGDLLGLSGVPTCSPPIEPLAVSSGRINTQDEVRNEQGGLDVCSIRPIGPRGWSGWIAARSLSLCRGLTIVSRIGPSVRVRSIIVA